METTSTPQQTSEKSVVIVNCPIDDYGEYIVSASSISAKSDLFLSLYIFDNTSTKEPLKLLTKIPISKIFTAIEWTSLGKDTEEHSLGFVIGGHEDGSVSLWDMTEILSNSNNPSNSQDFGCINQKQLFEDSVNVLACNEKPNLFAVGTTQINVVSIDKNFQMSTAMSCPPPQKGGTFTTLNWNDKVNHILASGTDNGSVYIYDMRKQSLFLEIMEPSQEDVQSDKLNTQVVWFHDGAQIIISYDNQEYNYLSQYHMKRPNAVCALYQNGHNTSIISLNKNPYDKHFLLSLGRDNVVTCWSLKTQKPLCKVQIDDPSSQFTQVIWSRKIKDCFICARNDGKLYSGRINFTEDLNLYMNGQELIPNWMRPTKCISFGFGGKLFKYAKDEKNNKENNIQVFKLNGNEELIKEIKKFVEKSEKNDLNEILDMKIEQAKNQGNKNSNLVLFWTALKSIYQKNIYLIFNEMGLNREEFNNEIASALGISSKKKENIQDLYMPQVEESAEDLNKLFEKPIEQNVPRKLSTSAKDSELPNTISEELIKNINWNVGNEKIIKKSLLLGDLESAVQLLFKNNRYCEALLIASTKPELFQKAKETYFSKENDLFVKSIFPAIINNNFELLFDYNVVKEWKEYLFYVNTYSENPEVFKNFADKLGDKLSTNPDIYSSLVCYILAEQYDKIINMLYNLYNKEVDKTSDKKELLHNLFEQIQLVNKIINIDRNPNEIYNKILYEYSLLLVEEGLNIEASKYLINIKDIGDENIRDLYERLYFNCELELGNTLARPSPKMKLIVLGQQNNQNRRANNLYNNNINNMNQVNRFQNPNQNKEIKDNRSTGFKPPVRPGQSQPFSRPVPGLNNNINNDSNINNKMPGRPPMMNNNINNLPRQPPSINQTKSAQSPFGNNQNLINQSLNNNPMSPISPSTTGANQGTQFNFGGNNARITKPPSFKPVVPNRMPKTTISTPPKPMTQNFNNNMNNMNNINNPPRMENPPPSKNIGASPFGSKIVEKEPENLSEQQKLEPLTQEEEIVYNYFSNCIETYNNAYRDENKRRDFSGKVNVLLKKLENHEFKHSLLKYLQDFINLKEKNDSNGLRRLYQRIQSIDWDKNKSWMPLLEKVINMRV